MKTHRHTDTRTDDSKQIHRRDLTTLHDCKIRNICTKHCKGVLIFASFVGSCLNLAAGSSETPVVTVDSLAPSYLPELQTKTPKDFRITEKALIG